MSVAVKVDARGLSCPEPVMLTRQAMDQKGAEGIEVMVDSASARNNVTRAAQTAGWNVEVKELPGGEFRMVLTR